MQVSLLLIDPDLCRNTTEYTYNLKYKYATEITLHFINIKELKFSYKQNGNKLARAIVAYLWEEMWRLQASQLRYNEAPGPSYYLETMENTKHQKP